MRGPSGTSARFWWFRYNADGTLDNGFGGGSGRVTRMVSPLSDGIPCRCHTERRQNPGHRHARSTLLGFDSDGTQDNGFGTNGKAEGLTFTQSALVIQSDGKILAGGDDFTVARLNADGSPDLSFNGTGKAAVNFGTGPSAINGIAVQPDGKVVAGGYSGGNFAIARFLADGTPDASFNGTGRATCDFGETEVGYALVMQSNGKIIVAGYSYGGASGNGDACLARFNANGTLDSSFGTGGKVVTDLGGGSEQVQAAALQPNGKLVVTVCISVHRLRNPACGRRAIKRRSSRFSRWNSPRKPR